MTTHHCPICGHDTGVPLRVKKSVWTPQQLDLLFAMRRVMDWKSIGRYFGVRGETMLAKIYYREREKRCQ